jgi:hypothetical protein
MKTILVLALLLSANTSFASMKVKSSLGQTLKELFIKEARKKGSFVNRAIPTAKSAGVEEQYGEYIGPKAKDVKASDLQVVIARSSVSAFAGDEDSCLPLTADSKLSPCDQSATVYVILSQTQGDPGGNSFYKEVKTTIFAIDITAATSSPDVADYTGEMDVSNFRLVKP